MLQNCSNQNFKARLRWITVCKTNSLAFFTAIPSWLRPIARVTFSTRPHSLFYDLSVALGLLLAAAAVRLFVDPIVSGRLPFVTFFPALVAVGVLCNLRIAMGFVIASAVLGWLLWNPPMEVDAYYQAVGSTLFILTAAVIVVLTEVLKDAYSQIAAAEERLRTINGELMHRIRNLFQISSAIVSQSARTASNPEEVAKAVSGRLSALSAAQTVAPIGAGEAPLASLVEVTLAPLRPNPGRLLVSGPCATLPAPAITMLALVLYELGTNALKYEAWSDLKGIVEVRWRKAAETLTIDWTERNGPPVQEPKRAGAGSKLIRNAIPEPPSITGSNAMARDAGSSFRSPANGCNSGDLSDCSWPAAD
jgi:two-component sensor histidine kinase